MVAVYGEKSRRGVEPQALGTFSAVSQLWKQNGKAANGFSQRLGTENDICREEEKTYEV